MVKTHLVTSHLHQDPDFISSLLGGIDELQVTLVEVSHGGNKPAADLDAETATATDAPTDELS